MLQRDNRPFDVCVYRQRLCKLYAVRYSNARSFGRWNLDNPALRKSDCLFVWDLRQHGELWSSTNALQSGSNSRRQSPSPLFEWSLTGSYRLQ